MVIVILAAGVGSRLGRPVPKPLTVLTDGRSIMQRQVEAAQEMFPTAPVIVAVGFKKDLVMEAAPALLFAYNERFGETNTAKSLLRALENTGDESALWMNGDVVFDSDLLPLLRPRIEADESFISVNTAAVGAEEVKYNLDDRGAIRELSKTVVDGLGEAVGVNYVCSNDKASLIARLEECSDADYFERAIELSIDRDGARYAPVDVTESVCIEVDFVEDLARANEAIAPPN
ncbi:NTP transferase domain-containing protein [Ilumatobacter sp.]|uniref:phosphocholine cytidylyltransferase family protein n=1 Tax=Ilumatobacter sp. TaxID=1967498 RepID=UPI003C5A6449